MMISDIQHKNVNQVSTPNPMSTNDIKQGLEKAREIAQKVDQVFKDRIQNPDVQVVGVGNIFAYGIYPAVGKKKPLLNKIYIRQPFKWLIKMTSS